MINAVTANFLGDNLQCWMQIQVGKGPWSSEVSGIVKIGQTMTMVMGIKVRGTLEMVTLAASSHDHDCLVCHICRAANEGSQGFQNYGEGHLWGLLLVGSGYYCFHLYESIKTLC